MKDSGLPAVGYAEETRKLTGGGSCCWWFGCFLSANHVAASHGSEIITVISVCNEICSLLVSVRSEADEGTRTLILIGWVWKWALRASLTFRGLMFDSDWYLSLRSGDNRVGGKCWSLTNHSSASFTFCVMSSGRSLPFWGECKQTWHLRRHVWFWLFVFSKNTVRFSLLLLTTSLLRHVTMVTDEELSALLLVILEPIIWEKVKNWREE